MSIDDPPHAEALPDLALPPPPRLLWRAPDSVHLERAGEGVIVEGLPPEVVAQLAAIDAPPRPRPPVDARLAPTLAPVLARLAAAGYLWPRARSGRPDPRVAAPVPRLAGQLTSLAARHGETAAHLLNARRYATVEVTGRSRLVASVAAVVAAAGVGHVHCAVDGST